MRKVSKTTNKKSLNMVRPISRYAQFKDILKNDYSLLIKIGLIFFVFAIPFFASFVGYSILGESLSNAESTPIMYFINDVIFMIAITISFVILSIGIAGCDKVFKLMCWDEPVIFWSDFKEGIKENFKKDLILCLIFSLMVSLVTIVSGLFTLLGNESKSGLGTIIYFVFSSPIIFVVFPLFLMSLIYNSYYKDPFKNMLKNSIKMTVYRYLPYILFIIPFILFIVLYVFMDLFYIALVALLVIFIGPVFGLGLHLYVLSVFDFYINSAYKDYYKKGLYQGGLSYEEN